MTTLHHEIINIAERLWERASYDAFLCDCVREAADLIDVRNIAVPFESTFPEDDIRRAGTSILKWISARIDGDFSVLEHLDRKRRWTDPVGHAQLRPNVIAFRKQLLAELREELNW
jgi:hypothetical protein